MELLDAGINIISVNIQHIESLNEEVKGIAGIEVKERIPTKYYKTPMKLWILTLLPKVN